MRGFLLRTNKLIMSKTSPQKVQMVLLNIFTTSRKSAILFKATIKSTDIQWVVFDFMYANFIECDKMIER